MSARFAGQQVKQQVKRYVGLCLGGAKSERTSIAVLDYYQEHSKLFVVDLYESIGVSKKQDQSVLTADQNLLELIQEISKENASGIQVIAVDAPLTLPPCFTDCTFECNGYENCKNPTVVWMQEEYRKAKQKNSKVKYFTPYSQRPVDVYFKYKHKEVFQDETLGSNLAPQTARMQYLKRFLKEINLIEVWPKLSLYSMMKKMKISKNEFLDYRSFENGAHIREKILEKIIIQAGLFVYERDLKKIISNIYIFDALMCAWVAQLYDYGFIQSYPLNFPLKSGVVQVPEL